MLERTEAIKAQLMSDDQGSTSRGNTVIYGLRVADEYRSVPDVLLPPEALGLGLVQDTSAHGIGHIFHARGIIKRFLWLLCFLSATGYLIFTVYSLVTEYIKHDVTVKVSLETASSLSFPAVTVCNQNPVRYSTVNQTEFAQFFVDAALPQDDQYDTDPFDDNYEYDYFEDEPEDETEVLEYLRKYISTKPDDEQFKHGHQLDDLILSCTYAGYACNISTTFVRTFNVVYGNCYTFNSGLVRRNFKQSHTGRIYGLSLVLNIEQDEYLPNITDKAGVRVVVHPQDDFPFPEDVGIDVSVGMSSSLGLRKISVNRLGGKFGDCSDPYAGDFYRNAYEEKYNWTRYTLPACQKTCFQKVIIDDCDCYDEAYIHEGVAFENSSDDLPPCSGTGLKAQCAHNKTEQLQDGTLHCDQCHKPCENHFFQLTTSAVSWPATTYRDFLLAELSKDDDAKSLIDKGLYASNFLQLEVYYEELNYEEISESEAYALSKFMSDMGGAMGMCLGASFITAMEFVELLSDLVVLFVRKAYKVEQQKKITHPETDEKNWEMKNKSSET